MDWASCIEDQVRTRGHVFEPWPEDPRELSLRLEVERVEGRHSREAERVRERAEALSDKSYANEECVIRPVASVSEMVEESERQHNCLDTYVGKVAQGETDIWLVRRSEDPDRPLVTVEVRDGSLRQAFRACNEQLTSEHMACLRAWCDRCGYRLPTGRMRALCA